MVAHKHCTVHHASGQSLTILPMVVLRDDRNLTRQEFDVTLVTFKNFLPEYRPAASDTLEAYLARRKQMSDTRTRHVLSLAVWVTLSLTPCFAHHMAVVVRKDNAVANLTSTHLARLVRGEVRKWPDGVSVVLVLHNSSPGEMATLQRLSKMTESDMKTWLAAHKDEIRSANSDADVLAIVASTPGAIGFVEEHSITDQVTVVKVDGRLPMEAGYLPH
jgi:hypothetical protein